MNQKAKDFFFSFVLVIVGVFTTVGGWNIYKKASLRPYNITTFTISPGFLPVVLGMVLILCSILLCLQTLKGSSSVKETVKGYCGEFKAWFKPAITSKDTFSMVVGALIMLVYSFYLVSLLHYIIASFVFLVGLMLFLKADKWWRIILISAGSVGLIYLLFKVCFQAALP